MAKPGGVLIAQILLIFAHSAIADEDGIGCFQCDQPLTGKSIEPSLLCSQFDEGFRFQVFCPHSTLCMKRTTFYTFPNGTSIPVSVQRGCAAQKYELKFIDYNVRKWVTINKVDTNAYQEGCYNGDENGSPGRPPEYCYCASTLCNGATKSTTSLNILYLLSIMTLLRIFVQ